MKADTGLQEKLNESANSDGVVSIAKEARFMISADDLTRTQSEISEEELEGMAGGNSINNTCNTLWCGCPRNTRTDPAYDFTCSNPQGC